jgi:hypothetical protein
MNRVKELLDLMRIREQLQLLISGMREIVKQQAEEEVDAKGYYTESSAYAKAKARFTERAFNIITIDEMVDDVTASYQRHFTDEDIEAFIAFYGSPAGQHFLDAQPTIMQEYQPVVMERLRERTKILREEIDAYFDSLDSKAEILSTNPQSVSLATALDVAEANGIPVPLGQAWAKCKERTRT